MYTLQYRHSEDICAVIAYNDLNTYTLYSIINVQEDMMGSAITNSRELKTQLESLIAGLEDVHRGKIDGMLEPKILSCDYEGRSAIIRYRFYNWMTNYGGSVHGGFSSLLLDSGIGWLASCYLGGEGVSAISLNIAFSKPVIPDEYLLVKAQLTDIKHRLVFGEGAIYRASEPEKKLVTGSVILYRRGVAVLEQGEIDQR
jgi:acyl-coenzyme A thioesterase PaaI-like protein